MRRIITYAKHLAVAVILTQLPTFLRADCIPSGTAGDIVPFTLVALKDNQAASGNARLIGESSDSRSKP
jgi:hypothetical protein